MLRDPSSLALSRLSVKRSTILLHAIFVHDANGAPVHFYVTPKCYRIT